MKLNAFLHSITDEGYTVTFSKKQLDNPDPVSPTKIYLHIKLERVKANGSGKESLEIPCVENSDRSIGLCLAVCRKEFISFYINKDHKKQWTS